MRASAPGLVPLQNTHCQALSAMLPTDSRLIRVEIPTLEWLVLGMLEVSA
jgi:hypothetical protein